MSRARRGQVESKSGSSSLPQQRPWSQAAGAELFTDASQVDVPGQQSGQIYHTGAATGELLVPGAMTGEVK